MQRIVLGLDGTAKDRDVVQWTADLAAAPEHHAMHDVVFGNFERRLVHQAKLPVRTIPCVARHIRLVR